MKQYFFLLFISLMFASDCHSQSILDLYPKYFASFGKIYGEKIERINGKEDKMLRYDQETFNIYKDSIENPEAIINVEIQFNEDLDLQKAFDDLALFPNLFYLKLSNMRFLSDAVILDLPKDFSGIKNVEFLHFMGNLGWDFQKLSNKLERLPNLKHLAINGLAKDKFSQLDFEKLRQIKGLYISGRQGAMIPHDIRKMTNLEGIIISADLYPDFEEQFSELQNLPSLKQVKLLYFTIENEDHGVFNDFGSLERLELSNVKVKDLNSFMEAFPSENNLEYLEIFGSESNQFTEGITRFDHLVHLKLERLGNSIAFPEDIFKLKNLKVLILSDNENFTTLSSEIKNLKELEKLTLYFNSLESIPEEIGALENLEYLNLKHNDLKILPQNLGNFSSLQTLILNTNKLKTIPESTGELTNLTKLDLETNQLKNLPESFPDLVKLKILKLNANDLKTLPADFGRLKELRELYLDQNLLKELPSSFSELRSLENLSLRNNELTSLPSFKDLKNLKRFDISNHPSALKISYYDSNLDKIVEDTLREPRKNNMVSILPLGFARLENLEVINISENPIETEALWEKIKNLKSSNYSLKAEHTGIEFLPKVGWENILAGSLFLRDNQIKSLPAEIVKAPFLKSLNLSQNPFVLSGFYESKEKLAVVLFEAGNLPESMLEKNAGTAKAYLDLSYQRKNRRNKLEYIEKAFKMDSSYTSSNIRESEYAEALLKEGEYHHAIDLFTQAIQQDTASRVRILNFTVPLFEKRAEAYLSIGDTLAAINDLQVVSSKFSAGNWGEAGLLAKKINEDSLAADSFQSGLEDYERQIQWNKKNERVNYGVQLSKLELFIIAEEFQKAEKYFMELAKETITGNRNEYLLEYFGLIIKAIERDLSKIEIEQFRQEVLDEEVSISGWSFEIFRKWLYQTELPQEKVSKMAKLTDILENQV